MIDIFVSYSRKDREIVKKLVEVMKGQGWSVWWDPTIRPGEYYEDVIESALTDSKCVVVVWSKNSVKSKWVRAEAAEAANRGVLVPVVIDDAKIPFRFKQIQEAHLSDWKFTPDHPELVRLLESIAEQFIKAQGAHNSQSIRNSREIEATPLSTPGSPLQEDTNQPSELNDAGVNLPPSSPIDEDSTLTDSASRIKPKTFQSEKAQPPRPIPVQPQTREAFTVGHTRPPLLSKRVLVAILLIISGLAVSVAIYFFASRESASSGNANQAEIAQQNRRADQLADVSNTSPTPALSPSPGSSPTESPAATLAHAKKIEGLLKGKWQSQNAAMGVCECSTSPCLDIQFKRPITDFCVESNQVYVSVRFQLDAANNKAYLFFKEPGDLGAGASRMPWDKFDRAKPLATIDLGDIEAQHVIYVTWHGFTEAGAAKQRWRQVGSGYQGTYLKQ